jgi:large subunit ribosomal protein L16
MQLKSPRRLKYKKYHKQLVTNTVKTEIVGVHAFGLFKLIALEPGRLSARHLEVLKRTARKVLKRSGKIWISTFPSLPITAKPLEVRMGKGKGSNSY